MTITAAHGVPANVGEVLPREVPTATHAPEVCAAWADERSIARATACPDHWESDDARKAREERLAAWRDRPLTPAEQADEVLPASAYGIDPVSGEQYHR